MKPLVLAMALAACSPSAQLKQMCLSQYDRCAFGQYGQLARYRLGVIEIDRARCDRDWRLCEWAIWHELGHANGHGTELAANCYALAHADLPAIRAAEEVLGREWEKLCQ